MEVLAVKFKPIIASGQKEKDFEELYEQAFPLVARFVRKMGGSFEDAKDIFHDALVIFHEKCKDEKFSLKTSAAAYVLGISKHLWIRKFSRNSFMVPLNAEEASIVIPEDYFPSFNIKKLAAFLEKSGKRCLELLRAFYFEKLKVKDIADSFGYATEHSVSVQKYKCLEKVRDSIKQKSIGYEDFIE